MDHLDIPAERATHKINYAVARICHVTNDDFKFVEKVDKSRMQLHAFGQLPFRSSSPYPNPVPKSGFFPPAPSLAEKEPVMPSPPHMTEEEPEVVVQPSLQAWMDVPGTSRQHPVDPSALPPSSSMSGGVEALAPLLLQCGSIGAVLASAPFVLSSTAKAALEVGVKVF